MKKFLVVVFIFSLIISPAFAAKKITSASSSGIKIGFGADNELAAIKFASDSFFGTVGLLVTNTNTGGASSTNFGIGGKFAFNLTGGVVPTHLGAGLSYVSVAGNTTILQISAVYGAETTILNKLNIGFDIYPVSFISQSSGGANSTIFSFLTGTVYCYYMF